jgi:2-dehydro-3-deoxyphosphogluconate aldolase/(4S)-4-hydroxy-2-oxoglutarate aldolase
MATRAATVKAIEAAGVVAVLRLADSRVAGEVASALKQGGVTIIEVTMTVPNAVALIAELSQSMDGVVIGAGTVINATMADDVMTAGARFVVSPVLRPEVIAACRVRDVAVVPGCFSPTEILTGWELGADIVKVFPSTALGPGYCKDLRGPLPQVKLMPTGGVTRENAGDWIRAGAVAVAVGTALVDPKAVAAGRFDLIADEARAFVEVVRHARGGVGVWR